MTDIAPPTPDEAKQMLDAGFNQADIDSLTPVAPPEPVAEPIAPPTPDEAKQMLDAGYEQADIDALMPAKVAPTIDEVDELDDNGIYQMIASPNQERIDRTGLDLSVKVPEQLTNLDEVRQLAASVDKVFGMTAWEATGVANAQYVTNNKDKILQGILKVRQVQRTVIASAKEQGHEVVLAREDDDGVIKPHKHGLMHLKETDPETGETTLIPLAEGILPAMGRAMLLAPTEIGLDATLGGAGIAAGTALGAPTGPGAIASGLLAYSGATYVAGFAGSLYDTYITASQNELEFDIWKQLSRADENGRFNMSVGMLTLAGIGTLPYLQAGARAVGGNLIRKTVNGNTLGALELALDLADMNREQAIQKLTATMSEFPDMKLEVVGAFGKVKPATYNQQLLHVVVAQTPGLQAAMMAGADGAQGLIQGARHRAQAVADSISTQPIQHNMRNLWESMSKLRDETTIAYGQYIDPIKKHMNGTDYSINPDISLPINRYLIEAKSNIQNKHPKGIEGFQLLEFDIEDMIVGKGNFGSLIDLRQRINKSGNYLEAGNKDAIDFKLQAINAIDNEMEEAVRRGGQKRSGGLGEKAGEEFMANFVKLNAEYSNFLASTNNIVAKALTASASRGGDAMQKSMHEFMGGFKYEYRDFILNLPEPIRVQAEQVAIQGIVEKYSIKAGGKSQAGDYLQMLAELKKFEFQTKEARYTIDEVIEPMAQWENDIATLIMGTNYSLPAFQSYLTPDPLVRLQFAAASYTFNATRAYLPGKTAKKFALSEQIAMMRAPDFPMNKKSADAFLRTIDEEYKGPVAEMVEQLRLDAAPYIATAVRYDGKVPVYVQSGNPLTFETKPKPSVFGFSGYNYRTVIENPDSRAARLGMVVNPEEYVNVDWVNANLDYARTVTMDNIADFKTLPAKLKANGKLGMFDGTNLTKLTPPTDRRTPVAKPLTKAQKDKQLKAMTAKVKASSMVAKARDVKDSILDEFTQRLDSGSTHELAFVRDYSKGNKGGADTIANEFKQSTYLKEAITQEGATPEIVRSIIEAFSPDVYQLIGKDDILAIITKALK